MRVLWFGSCHWVVLGCMYRGHKDINSGGSCQPALGHNTSLKMSWKHGQKPPSKADHSCICSSLLRLAYLSPCAFPCFFVVNWQGWPLQVGAPTEKCQSFYFQIKGITKKTVEPMIAYTMSVSLSLFVACIDPHCLCIYHHAGQVGCKSAEQTSDVQLDSKAKVHCKAKRPNWTTTSRSCSTWLAVSKSRHSAFGQTETPCIFLCVVSQQVLLDRNMFTFLAKHINHILYNWRKLSALTFMVCSAARGYDNFNTKCGNPPTPNKLPLHPWCLKNNHHFRFWTFLGHLFQGQYPSVPRHSKLTVRDAVVLPIPWVFCSIWDNGTIWKQIK